MGIFVTADVLGVVTNISIPYDMLQYRLLIPAPVDQASANAQWYRHTWITRPESKFSTEMARVACEKATFSCEVRHLWVASMTSTLGGNRACGRGICLCCPHT